ncbi:MAG: response regulator [Bacteroidia bacterium]|nr:response regulator [Bacteroidia bacterium]
MKRFKEAWIIDDNWLDVFGIKRLMKHVGFSEKILTYSDGYEALNELTLIAKQDADKCPDVILLDIKMPDWDGWRFLDFFVELGLQKKTELYLISTSILETDITKANRYDVISQCYEKPINQVHLKEIMQSE